MLFSPSTRFFYHPALRYPDAPKDLVEISDEDHDSAISAPEGAIWGLSGGEFVIQYPQASAQPEAEEPSAN